MASLKIAGLTLTHIPMVLEPDAKTLFRFVKARFVKVSTINDLLDKFVTMPTTLLNLKVSVHLL